MKFVADKTMTYFLSMEGTNRVIRITASCWFP